MKPATKLAAFAAAIAIVFAGALAVGAAAPSVGVTSRAGGAGDLADGGAMGTDGSMGADGAMGNAEGDDLAMDEHGPEGLSSTEDGFRLELAEATLPLGRSELAFRIVDEAGEAVRDVEVEHERPMHVIVVRRDLATYAHLHPRVDDGGTWRTPIHLADPGAYRVIADLVPVGGEDDRSVTLGTDAFVDGSATTEPLPAPADTAFTGPYEVTLIGAPSTQPETELAFTVARNGEPVEDLEPYLGAGGHLVAIRGGDLAYTHLHAEALTGDATLRFTGGLPGAGSYRMFLQFRHDGRVHTVAFTVEVTEEDHR